MYGTRLWIGHPALSRPLTIMGVERRFFMLAATMGMAMWNLLNSITVSGLIFGTLYGAGLMAWRRDPAMLQIVAAGQSARTRYDPGKPSTATVELI